METISPSGKSEAHTRFKPTYKEWKLGKGKKRNAARLVLSLPTRNGNSNIFLSQFQSHLGFKPTYKEWKQTVALGLGGVAAAF